jgi:sulfoquinovosyltransferase
LNLVVIVVFAAIAVMKCIALMVALATISVNNAFSPLFTPQAKIAATKLNAKAFSSADAPPLRRNPPRKVCLMVEPTPFTHVSGYANRFKEMLKFMQKAGDEVDILTVDSKTDAKKLPKKMFGFRIQHTLGFTFPLYNQISLTCDLPEMKGAQICENFKPDLIHVTSP